MRYLHQIDWHSADDLHHYNAQFAYLEMTCHPERLYNNYEVTPYYKDNKVLQTRWVSTIRVELKSGFGYNERVGLH